MGNNAKNGKKECEVRQVLLIKAGHKRRRKMDGACWRACIRHRLPEETKAGLASWWCKQRMGLEALGFLLRILWCIQSGYHPENNLAKFGYILDMKLGERKKERKKNRILLKNSWLSSAIIIKNMGIRNLFFSKYIEFGLFFPWKFL